MKKILSISFLFSLLIVNSQTSVVVNDHWRIAGNTINNYTNYIGTNTNRSLRIKVFGLDAAKLDSVKIWRLYPTTSTLNIGGSQWYNSTDGLTLFTPSTGVNNGRSHINNGGIKGFDLPLGNGGNYYDGYWIGTSTAHNIGFIANASSGVPSVVIEGEGRGQQGALMINPTPTVAGYYFPNAMLEVWAGASNNAFRTYTVTGNTSTPVVDFNTTNNKFTKSVRIGSQTAPSETLDVTGTGAFSGSLTVGGTISASNFLSSSYTPGLTNVTNVTASTAYITGYYRIGNSVTVYGKIDIDATLSASAATEVGVALPIASNFTGEEDLGGDASSDGVASLVARIKADAVNDRASIVFKAISLTNDSYSFTFSYQIK